MTEIPSKLKKLPKYPKNLKITKIPPKPNVMAEIPSNPKKKTKIPLSGVVFVHGHVSSVGGVTLLDPNLFWGVQSGTRHWAT